MPTTESDSKIKAFFDTWNNPIGEASSGDPFVERFGASLYGSDATKNYLAKLFGRLPENQRTPENLKAIADSVMGGATTPFNFNTSTDIPFTDAKGNAAHFKSAPIKDTLGIIGANIGAHPVKSLGTAANLGMNVSGLLDNDKFGGQLAGAAAGVALPMLAGAGLGPLGMINAAGIGGNLGALFDKLREKKAQEQQYGGNY